MRVLSLYSGIGALDLGMMIALDDYSVCCYCEIDPLKRSILNQRIEDSWLPRAPVHEDVRSLEFVGSDMLVAGYPCQWASSAARGRNVELNLWSDVERHVSATSPPVVFLENVVYDYWACSSLERLGYRVLSHSFSAAELGAPHVRERVFTLGLYSDGKGESARTLDAAMAVLPKPEATRRTPWDEPRGDLRVADGTPDRLEQAQTVGDAAVPLVAAHALVSLSRRMK